MTAARRAEIESLFERALDLSPEQRGSWLGERCTGDAALRAEVEALLEAHAQADGILDRSAAPFVRALAPEPLHDRRIGPYRVVRELGRGGMGVVYLAERVDGEFRREVAIKLLRSSPDADELHRRFVAERQILASLSHPNIAQLLDGGTTDGQLPYLVMEYVNGMPITTYCDRHALDVAARLRLFVDVCRAVHAAHQNLVIHRDIKPGNILVTATGQVKLLDFGIAKLLNAGLVGFEAPHTVTAFRVMTPDYASPEQVRGESLATTSDVYALGVVLYELLAGRRPYQLRTGAVRELEELVCEREPERPSTEARRALGSGDDTAAPTPLAIAAARSVTPDRLHRQLAGDVDAIVMMALRKEPRRRYGSAELLAEDIERHLDGLPVVARHASRAYFVGKFLHRHRAATGLGALAALSLVLGTAVALDQAAAARRESERASQALVRAEEALRESEETTSFLVGLFDSNLPSAASAAPGTTDELLARGMTQVEALAGQPLVQARMLDGMGRIYQNSGRFMEARGAYERSLALRRANGVGGKPDEASTLLRLADVLRLLGSYVTAESTAWRALRIREGALGREHPSTAEAYDMLSMLSVYRGDLISSEKHARRSVEIRRAAYGPDDPRIAYGLEMLAGALRRRGAAAEAERLMRQAIALYERGGGPNDPALALPLQRLAEAVASDRGDLAEAQRLLQRAVAITSAQFGLEHPRTAYALSALGELESRRGELASGERHAQQAADVLYRAFGADNISRGDALAELARVQARAGRFADAERTQREAMGAYGRVLTRQHPAYAGLVFGLGEMYMTEGRLDEAEALFRQSIDIRRAAVGPEKVETVLQLAVLGDLRVRHGQLAAADSLYGRALVMGRAQSGDSHPLTRAVYARLAELRARQGRPAEAADYRRRANGAKAKPLSF